jgi:hypothetical protein
MQNNKDKQKRTYEDKMVNEIYKRIPKAKIELVVSCKKHLENNIDNYIENNIDWNKIILECIKNSN